MPVLFQKTAAPQGDGRIVRLMDDALERKVRLGPQKATINPRGLLTFTYGKIEARIWVPPGAAGVANWPAFWANGTGTWPITGELDVMEGLEGHTCFHFHSTLGGPGGCAPLASPSGWHTYAADWEPGSVTYFYDGVQVGRVTSGITASPMYLILNLAVSPSISPPVQLPSEMLVDWVRVTR